MTVGMARQAKAMNGRRALAERADHAIARALSLALLGEAPQEGKLRRPFAGREAAADIIARILRSAAFREGIVEPFLARRPIPQQRLGGAGLQSAATALARLGLAPLDGGPDWIGLFAALLAADAVEPLLAEALPEHAAALVARARDVLAGLAAFAAPIGDDDVRALYILLLDRLPESAALYDAHRGRPRRDLLREMLQSEEFRDGVAAAFAVRALPPRGLGADEISAARHWLIGLGIAKLPEEADWSTLVAAFLAEEPAATLLQQPLADLAPAIVERLPGITKRRAAAAADMDGADVKALYLLLFGHPPEEAAIYDLYRARRRSELIGEALESREFRNRVLTALLCGTPLPHEALSAEDEEFCRDWLAGFGLEPTRSGGWRGLVGAFLLEGCPADRVPPDVLRQAPFVGEAIAAATDARHWGERPADGSDVKALHLILLARLPDSEEAYAAGRGQTRHQLVVELMQSAVFAREIQAPFVAEGQTAHRRLSREDCGFARSWLARSGLAPVAKDADWLDLFAGFMLAEPVAAIAAQETGNAPQLIEKAAALRRARQAERRPLDDAGVGALFLMLLGRPPESDALLRERRGRTAAELAGDIVGSAEFRNCVLQPLLAGEAVPQQQLSEDRIEIIRQWLESSGGLPAGAEADWIGLLAGFLARPAISETLDGILPERGAILRQRAAERASAPIRNLESRLKTLEQMSERHLPAFLNAVATVKSLARQVARLSGELEALRTAAARVPPPNPAGAGDNGSRSNGVAARSRQPSGGAR